MRDPLTGEPITVNIDEWMKGSGERLQPAKDMDGYAESLTPEERERVRQRREEMREQIERMEQIQARHDLLDAEARECGECGRVEAHYKEDYVCFECRDKMEEPHA